MFEGMFVVVIVTAIWVFFDANKLGAKRGGLGGGLLDMGPGGWTMACLLFWLVAFPLYLINRPQLLERAGTKKCPQCAEFVKKEAIKCRYCGSELVPDFS